MMITESPLRNILLTYRSLFTAAPLDCPFPPVDVSVHISFTSSSNLKGRWDSTQRNGTKTFQHHSITYKFICRSYALTRPRSLWLFRMFTITCVLSRTALYKTLKGPDFKSVKWAFPSSRFDIVGPHFQQILAGGGSSANMCRSVLQMLFPTSRYGGWCRQLQHQTKTSSCFQQNKPTRTGWTS